MNAVAVIVLATIVTLVLMLLGLYFHFAELNKVVQRKRETQEGHSKTIEILKMNLELVREELEQRRLELEGARQQIDLLMRSAISRLESMTPQTPHGSAMSEVFHGYRLADRGDQDQSVVNAVLESAQSLISETSPTQGLAPVAGLWARRAHIQ